MMKNEILKWLKIANIAVALGISTYLICKIPSRLKELNAIKPVTEKITLEEIPSTLNLWVGVNKNDAISIKIDREKYKQLVNNPRGALSQYAFDYFITSNETFNELTEIILNAPQSNFNMTLSEPCNVDGFENTKIRRYLPVNFRKTDYVKILDFVRANVTYERDKGGGYAKFPLETLVEKSGDCEDMAYLVATLLRNKRKMGIVYEFSRVQDQTIGHVTLAIARHPNEELPYNIFYDDNKYMDVAKKLISNGEIPENAPFIEMYEKPFEHQGVVVKSIKPIVIKYDSYEYFLIETTASGYDIKESLEKDFRFFREYK